MVRDCYMVPGKSFIGVNQMERQWEALGVQLQLSQERIGKPHDLCEEDDVGSATI